MPAVLGGLAAGEAALADKPLNQQRIAPKDCTYFIDIEQRKDVRKVLYLVHPAQNKQQWFAGIWIQKIRLNYGDLSHRIFEGPFQAP